ncbi:hypothetical protein EDB87DRAFT_1579827 [Lactarius vividus]|nr:hypothetical protein EDB87DRAFT_1579827 [Lactarius vividus]
MWSPITHISPPLSAGFISPPPKWLDSDDDFEHEPALISDDALSSGCSRAPSLAPLDSEDPHIDIVSSPVQDTFFRAFPSSRAAPLSRYHKPLPSNHAKSPTTREDVAAALLALRAHPRLSSSRPVLPNVWTQPAAETQQQHPTARRSRVISPSLRNLVLPRTPSPPPPAPLPMTNYSPIIDSDHKAAYTAPPQRTPASSSPLPPSSPFAEDDEYEGSAPTRFHSLPSPKPEYLSVHISPDNSETEEPTYLSRDRESKEDNIDSHSITREVITATSHGLSPVPECTPDERPLVHERHPSAPHTCAPIFLDGPVDSSLVPVLGLTSVPSSPQTPLTAPANEIAHQCAEQPLPHVSIPPIPTLPAAAPPIDDASLIPDITDPNAYAVHSESRATSPVPTALDPDPVPCLDHDLNEHRTVPLSPSPQRSHPASSPLSSPPSSPSPEKHQRRTHASPSPPPAPCSAGTKRLSPEEAGDRDADDDADIVDPASTTSAAPVRARSKRRRQDANADDKPWRDRKKHAHAPLDAPTPLPTTTHHPAPPPDPDAPEPCPHPALLGLLLETLALSRASSLTQSALVRTNPDLAPTSSSTSSAMLAMTLRWAVHARVLGCVRSSGEALPPSYFYDPTMDPDRERGELLRCLMPRAGKRRETMKYKQYYWAPVVVGRGRTRTWDVDWEE